MRALRGRGLPFGRVAALLLSVGASWPGSGCCGRQACNPPQPVARAAAWCAAQPPARISPPARWEPQGPAPIEQGQVEKIPLLPVVGAVRSLAPHQTNPDILYAATVNGGVWRTANATAAEPHWVALTDDQPSLSMGVIEYDPTDTAGKTLLAGVGRFSSLASQGGAQGEQLLYTKDDGAHWVLLTDPLFRGSNFTAVAARGPVLLAASNSGNGLLRRADPSSGWLVVSGAAGSHLPAGPVLDLTGNPREPARLYCVLRSGGVFRSDDTGATWRPIRPMPSLVNARLSVATNGRLYLGAVKGRKLSYVGYTDAPTDPTPSWRDMDVPKVHAGGQGDMHFSLLAHAGDPTLVIVGGDRQDLPSSIGATDRTAQIWLGDSKKRAVGSAPSPQWSPLTHNGASGSAPHADSRDLAMDASGRLLECDDGGAYARPSAAPGAATWAALVGDLMCSEFHHIAYDRASHVLFGACQDTGTPYQLSSSGCRWATVPSSYAEFTGDGAIAACDDVHLGTHSYRYIGWYELGYFVRQEWDGANALVAEDNLGASLNAARYAADSYPALELNSLASSAGAGRFILGGSNGLYEGVDYGNTIQRVTDVPAGDGLGIDPVAFGGRKGGVENPDVLWFGSRWTNQVFVRTAPYPAPAAPSTTYTWGPVRDLVLDPDDWSRAFVTDGKEVLTTPDAAVTWSKITGGLGAAGGQDVWSLALVRGKSSRVLLAGTGAGVFASAEPWSGTWVRLGKGLPNALTRTLTYCEADDVLVAGTMGRGAWVLRGASKAVDAVASRGPP